jgi:hypothetical protein
MVKIFFITFASVLILSPLKADAQEKIKSNKHFDKESFLLKRSAFITAELGLTSEEAAAFIPLCEELQQKKFDVGHKCRKLSKRMHPDRTPTDAEYLQAIDECLGVGLKEAELEIEYYQRFKEILSPAKLYRYREADHRFMREFMKTSEGNKK